MQEKFDPIEKCKYLNLNYCSQHANYDLQNYYLMGPISPKTIKYLDYNFKLTLFFNMNCTNKFKK